MYNPEQPIFETQPDSTVKVSIGVEENPKSWWQTLFFAWQITLVDFTPSSGPACSFPSRACPTPSCRS